MVHDVEDGRLALTHLGRACAAKGLGVRTSAKMAVWAAESRDAAVAEIVSLLGTTVAGAGMYVAHTARDPRRS